MADSMVEALIGSTVAMICVTTLVISIRMAVRTSLRTCGLDDVLITASWVRKINLALRTVRKHDLTCNDLQVFAMAMFTATMISTHSGFGRHHQDVNISDYEQFLKVHNHFYGRQLTIATSATYSYGLALAKMSFAVLYIRMLPDRRLVMMNKAIILFLCCQAIEESLIPIFQCNPIAKAWTVGMEGSCLDLPVLWWSGPIPTLWNLQLPLVKRLGLIAMLSLGLLVVAISVIRMHSVTEMGIDDTPDKTAKDDLATPILWSEAEISTLIVCSCVPSLRKVVQKLPCLSQPFGIPSIDTPPRAIKTIGQTRQKRRFPSKCGSGQERYCTIGSDSTSRTLTYPLSVLSRPLKASDTASEGPQETLRTNAGNDGNSIGNLQKRDLKLDYDVERDAGDVVGIPEEMFFPTGNLNEKVRSESK
ncbi:hypothetical protein BDP55DRAFT_720060 [Colletotrichum godetiae]|uniref:Rhodopsin domain-containing protein n=1 Tax=Colletotrichum godetiae TaxID=1209918 RepID=A0AAJ0ES48_9PEZI|nr:uncharacterized protein BDP55DRAFT_720060 [Colletotrichum godetiae]KAK1659133.1 hypothetical protein BDP55DRAFT_720060 [Colletotrichum godetiae]